MKIKTQSFLLLSGIIIIPIVLLVSYWLMFHHKEQMSFEVPPYEEIFKDSENLATEQDWKKMSSFIARRPANMDITILDRATMTVLYSTVESYPKGFKLESDSLINIATQDSDKFFFNISTPMYMQNNNLIILTKIKKSDIKPRPRFERYVNTVTIISTIILLFCIAMVTMMIRSIATSVTVLKNAAERVTHGELDQPIEVRGSNEVISLTESLNELRLAVKENRARQARFIMGISHDLKTPLALIKGYVEALYDEIPTSPEERKQYAQIILKKADDLEVLINDLIDFIKVDTGEWRNTWQDTDITEFLNNTALKATEAATILKRKFSYKVDIPNGKLVQMDEKLVTRCFENLISNAIRYTETDGEIELRSYEKDIDGKICCIVEIKDNGIGIDKNELNNIFDMFYRGTSSRREKGSGLGLAIVKSIINSHNWEISAESEPGRGSVFTISMPLK